METESDPNKIKSEPHRRSPLGYLNYMAASRSLRYALTREKLRESLKTMIWVIPLTLLIWIYAEREQIVYPNSPNANGVEVHISSTNPRRFVEPVNPDPTVNLKLTGPQEAIEKVKEQLLSTVPRGVSIDTADMIHGDNQPINIVDRIQNLPVFKNNGVTVVESQPADVLVNIYDTRTEEFPVEISPADAGKVSPQTRFDPARVAVEGPTSLLRGDLHVYADLALIDLKNVGEQIVPVKLATPDPRLHISPTKVSATLVMASNKTVTVQLIPIVVQVSAATLKAYDVTSVNGGDDTLGTTQLTGPGDQIDLIQNAVFKPKAILELSNEDYFREHSKSVRYELPPGVHVVGDNADLKVAFVMTPRKDN